MAITQITPQRETATRIQASLRKGHDDYKAAFLIEDERARRMEYVRLMSHFMGLTSEALGLIDYLVEQLEAAREQVESLEAEREQFDPDGPYHAAADLDADRVIR